MTFVEPDERRVLVSVGVPVFNGADGLRKALDCLVNQTFRDIEIIISNNASIDETHQICTEYAKKDSRIKYHQHNETIGYQNFNFVLEKATGKYFCWNAHDDYRSLDYFEKNVEFLETHQEYSASMSPNWAEVPDDKKPNVVSFSLEGRKIDRFRTFFEHALLSHGVFYSLMRTDTIRQYPLLDRICLAADWNFNLHLLHGGPVARIEDGYFVSGVSGLSNRRNVWKHSRTHQIERLIPLFWFSLEALKITRDFPLLQRLDILWLSFRINLKMLYLKNRELFVLSWIGRFIKRCIKR